VAPAPAFAGTIFAALTGLVDWWGMVPGSRKRRWVTWHMLLRLTTLAIFLVDFAIRWPDRHQPEADALWIGVEVVGVAVLAVAQWFGGVLVYRMGMRVSTAEDAETERA